MAGIGDCVAGMKTFARSRLSELAQRANLVLESHQDLKHLVPQTIGIIWTEDSTPYSNVIVESA